ncbi:hypothetical protein [Amorphus coralli]|nr:hypothetical protein [Amorphus coralli]
MRESRDGTVHPPSSAAGRTSRELVDATLAADLEIRALVNLHKVEGA